MEQIEEHERIWSEKIEQDRRNYKWLSFLTNRGIIEIHKLIKNLEMSFSKKHVAKQILKKLRFLISESDFGHQIAMKFVSYLVYHIMLQYLIHPTF